MMNTSVSILTELPEELHKSLKHYLEDHPSWDQDQVFTAALSLFLLQNNSDSDSDKLEAQPNQHNPQQAKHYRTCARAYLETLFHT